MDDTLTGAFEMLLRGAGSEYVPMPPCIPACFRPAPCNELARQINYHGGNSAMRCYFLVFTIHPVMAETAKRVRLARVVAEMGALERGEEDAECNCTFGFYAMKPDCPLHGHLVRGSAARGGNMLALTMGQKHHDAIYPSKRAPAEVKEYLRQEFAAFDRFIDDGGFVPSGNYCRCCERYDCGCSQAAANDRYRDANPV